FTEVGYVGRDVDTIIRDLVEVAVKDTREAETRKGRDRAADNAEERLLDVLLPPAAGGNVDDLKHTHSDTRGAETRKVRDRAADNAEERLLDVLLPPAREVNFDDLKHTDSATRQKFRKMLREGVLDDREVEIEVATMPAQMEIMAPPGMEELTSQI